MNHLTHSRYLLMTSFGLLLLLPLQTPAQSQVLLKPEVTTAATNHRLILKDGSYQLVRKYEIVGDRVRYISVERSGDWEELPEALVDWEATKKWEREHAGPEAPEALSPGMKEAEEIDKAEVAERDELTARRPEVARGLTLPDEDAVFVLDRFQGAPVLVELLPADLNLDAKAKRGLSTLNPMAGSKASLELDGQRARVHLHERTPSIYLSLASHDEGEPLLSHPLMVETGGAKDVTNHKHGAHSPTSGFAIVRVDVRRAVRIVGAIHVSQSGTVTQSEDVIPAKAELLPGKHWMKLTPEEPLTDGEYALVEILSAEAIDQSVWDFRVEPNSEDNEGSIGPIGR